MKSVIINRSTKMRSFWAKVLLSGRGGVKTKINKTDSLRDGVCASSLYEFVVREFVVVNILEKQNEKGRRVAAYL